MKKGCVISLATWAIATAAYFVLLRMRIPWPKSMYVSLAEGLFLTFVVGAIQTMLLWMKRAHKVSAATTFSGMPGEGLKDGDSITVVGRIRPTGPVLNSPFSGKPAVLYSYDIKDPAIRQNKGEAVGVYSGFALTPSVVDTRQGSVRLLGFPTPEKSDEVEVRGEEVRQNAENWIASTPFNDKTGINAVTSAFREAKEILTDDDGELRKDWRLRDDPELAGKRFYEYVVAPGEQVCLMGTYSAAKGGVIPNLSGGDAVQLMRGDPAVVARQMRMKGIGTLVAGILLAVFANGLLFLFLKFGPR